MCGIIGTVGGDPEDLELFINSLCRVNNRGHEAVGISARAKGQPHLFRYPHWGMVREACTADRRTFRNFTQGAMEKNADAFVGHTRYSTVGPSDVDLIQPFTAIHPEFGEFVLAHNGQIVNHQQFRQQCEVGGHRFKTESDSEVLTALIARSPTDNLADAVRQVVREVPGVFSLLAMNQHQLVAARDRFGVKPLWFNYSPKHFYLASESAALAGTSDPCEVDPGSILCFNFADYRWFQDQIVKPCRAHCILEVLYFSRPDQQLGKTATCKLREAEGEQLAEECPVDIAEGCSEDEYIICGVPASGCAAARGYARRSGIRLEPDAIVRNVYSVSGRSFILPDQKRRVEAARMKYAVTAALVRGKRVLIVDDTIVRLTTMPVLVQMMWDAGAIEVHVRVAAAPIRYICDKGIDMSTTDELPAATMSEEQIRQKAGATSLRYLPYTSMVTVANRFSEGWCTACFDGQCPVNQLVSLTNRTAQAVA